MAAFSVKRWPSNESLAIPVDDSASSIIPVAAGLMRSVASIARRADDSHALLRRRAGMNRHATGSPIITSNSDLAVAPKPKNLPSPTFAVTTKHSPDANSIRFAIWRWPADCGPRARARSSWQSQTELASFCYGSILSITKRNSARRAQVASAACEFPGASCEGRLYVSLFDEQVSLAWNDELVLSYPYERPGTRNRLPALFGLAAVGMELEVCELRIERDVYYTPRVPEGRETKARLGPGEFFVLGDNSPQSRDSRWSPISARVFPRIC